MTAVSKTAGATNAQTSKLTPVNSSKSTEAISPSKDTQPGTQEITPTISAQLIPPPPIAPQFTIHDVMKMLEIGNQKKELHEEFSKRVLNLENFKQRYENRSLKMIIIADADEDEITVSNHEIIIEALEKTVVKGRDYLKRIEMELLSIF